MSDDTGATFFFDTNIDDVVQQIQAGLAKLKRETNAATKGTPEDTRQSLVNVDVEGASAARDTILKLQRTLQDFADGAARSGSTVTGEFKKIRSELDKTLGEITGRRGLTLDVALKIRQQSSGDIDKIIESELSRIRAGAGNIDPARVGTTRVTPTARDFGSGFNPTGDLSDLTAEINRTLKSMRAAADKASALQSDVQAQAAATQNATAATDAVTTATQATQRAQNQVTAATDELAKATREAADKASAAAGGGGGKKPPPPPPAAAEPAPEEPAKKTAGPLIQVPEAPPVARTVSKDEERQFLAERQRDNARFVEQLRNISPEKVTPLKVGRSDGFQVQDEEGVLRVFKSVGVGLTALELDSVQARTAIDNLKESMLRAGDAARQAAAQTTAKVAAEQAQKTPGADAEAIQIDAGEGSRLKRPTTALDRAVQAEGNTESLAQAQARLKNIFEPNPTTGTPQLRGDVTSLGSGFFKAPQFDAESQQVLEGTQRRYYKVIGQGLEDLTTDARRQLEAIQIEAKSSAATPTGLLANFAHGLTSGGFGGGGKEGVDGIANAAGTTVKYSLLYSTLGLVQQGFSQAGAQLLNFEDSNTNLQIAIENTTGKLGDATQASGDFLTSLQNISGTAGVNVGDVMDVAASGIRTLGNDANGSVAQVKQLGNEYARQVAVMAVLSKTTLQDANGNLRAIAGSFSIPITAATRINDAIVTGKNVGGGDETQTSQALATFSEAANAAGFTPELAAALVSRVQARTDEAGASVGTKLSRLTTIAGGTAGQKALAELNATLPKNEQIDLNAKVGIQLTQLSQNQDKYTDAQKKALTNTLAGTGASKEFLVVLKDLYGLTQQPLFKPGSAQEEYQRRLGDLTQTVRDLKAVLSNIVISISGTGALDLLVLAFKAAVNLLQSFNTVIQTFDLLPSSIRNLGVPIIELTALIATLYKVVKAGSISEGVGGVLGNLNAKARPQDTLARLQLADRASAAEAASNVAGNQAASAAKVSETEAIAAGTEATKQAVVADEAAARAAAIAANASADDVALTRGGRAVTSELEAALPPVITRSEVTAAKEAESAVIGQAALRGAPIISSAEAAGQLPPLITASEVAAASSTGSSVIGVAGTGVAEAGVAETGAAGAAAGLGVGLSSLAGPVALAVGAVTLFAGAVKGRANDISDANKLGRDALEQQGKIKDFAPGDQAQAYRNAASADLTAAKAGEVAGKGFGFLAQTAQDRALIQQEKDAATTAQNLALTADAQQKALADSANSITAFGDPATLTAEKLSKGLDNLATAGQSAAVRVKTLISALGAVPGADGALPVNKQATAAAVTSDLVSGIGESTSGKLVTGRPLPSKAQIQADLVKFETGGGAVSFEQQAINDAKDPKRANPLTGFLESNTRDISDLISKELPQAVKGTDGRPTDQSATKISDDLAALLLPKYKAKFDALDPDAQKQVLAPAAFGALVQRTFRGSLASINVTTGQRTSVGPTSGAEILSRILTGIEPSFNAQLATLDPGDTQGKIDTLKQEQATIQGQVNKGKAGSDGLTEALVELNKVRQAVAQAVIDRQDDIRKTIQAGLTDPAAVLHVGQAAFASEATQALQNGNLATLKAIIARGGKADVKLLQDSLAHQLSVAKAAEAEAQTTAAALAAADPQSALGIYGSGGGHYEGRVFVPDQGKAADSAAVAAAKKNVKDIQSQQSALNTALTLQAPGKISAFDTGSDANKLSATEILDNSISLRNRFADSAAALDAARRAVDDARDRASLLQPGMAGYGAAVAAFALAQRALSDELAIGAKDIVERLSIDISNPVATAQADLDKARNAQAQAVKDIASGKTKFTGTKEQQAAEKVDFLGKFELDSRTARLQVESATQTQFLSNLDVAERLGRISHAQYINLLTGRGDQLRAELAKMKTSDAGYKQIQDEINQIDLAVKASADTLSGVFNIGDIKVPTVYEVRKAIAQKYAGDVLASNGSFSTAGNVTNDNSTQNVILNGVPLQVVLNYVNEAFGKKARAQTNRKVSAR